MDLRKINGQETKKEVIIFQEEKTAHLLAPAWLEYCLDPGLQGNPSNLLCMHSYICQGLFCQVEIKAGAVPFIPPENYVLDVLMYFRGSEGQLNLNSYLLEHTHSVYISSTSWLFIFYGLTYYIVSDSSVHLQKNWQRRISLLYLARTNL